VLPPQALRPGSAAFFTIQPLFAEDGAETHDGLVGRDR